MHIRHPRAAVAVDEPPRDTSPRGLRIHRASSTHTPSPRTLWASPALPVRGGRLIGVRLRAESVEVALIVQGGDRIRWIPAVSALTEFQAALWLKTSQFAP